MNLIDDNRITEVKHLCSGGYITTALAIFAILKPYDVSGYYIIPMICQPGRYRMAPSVVIAAYVVTVSYAVSSRTKQISTFPVRW